MRVFSYILFPIIILIGLIIKKNEKKWCFGSWFGLSYTDNTKYLFLEAVKRKDVRAIWITKSKEIVKEIRGDGHECYMAYSVRGIAHQLTSGWGNGAQGAWGGALRVLERVDPSAE